MRRLWPFLLLVPGLALGSQLVKRTLAERARLADRVVLAQVLSSRSSSASTSKGRGPSG
jgi:hypothetical protein